MNNTKAIKDIIIKALKNDMTHKKVISSEYSDSDFAVIDLAFSIDEKKKLSVYRITVDKKE